jgi:hypothetical protein
MPSAVPRPSREDFSGDDLELFDRVIARYRKPTQGPETLPDPGPYFGPLLHWPAYAENRAQLSTLVRTAGERPGTYSHAEREWVDMVLSPFMGTNIHMPGHMPDAIAVGVRPEAIKAIRSGRDQDLTEDELLLATYIRQVVSGSTTEETRDAIEKRLGRRGLVEYTVFITVLQLTTRQAQAFGAPDPPNSEVDRMLDELIDGTRPLPDWRAKIR